MTHLTHPENNTDHVKPILIVTAVQAERDAIMRGLSRAGGDDQTSVVTIAAGAGPAAAAAVTAEMLALGDYSLVISAGIGGGFPDVAPIGSLVLADTIIAADLGAETQDGFLSLDELGFGTSIVSVNADWHDRVLVALKSAALRVCPAPILTVSSATGTAETAAKRLQRAPTAAAEAMEGFGVALAARRREVAALELRAISNAVGPRDRDAWRIGEALAALEAAAAAMAAVFFNKE